MVVVICSLAIAMPISTNIIQASDPSALSRATEVLGNGGVVAIPTETVYGLAAAINNLVSLNKIFSVKGRPTSHPLIAHLSSVEELQHWATDVSSDALMLVEACWPGPLSVLLNRSEKLPYLVTGNRETAVFRIPANDFSRQLISAVGVPIAAPSANRFGKVSPTTAQHVFDDLGSEVDLIIDGGPCTIGVESTIVDFTCDPPQLLRPGGIPQEDIESILGKALQGQQGESRASGMLLSHYSPSCQILIANDLAHANDLLTQQQTMGNRTRLTKFSDDLPIYASTLYSQMREADTDGLDSLIAIMPDQQGLGLAILDRLLKASAPRI
jgi:L-threonylcarbamoyladenylate synthase